MLLDYQQNLGISGFQGDKRIGGGPAMIKKIAVGQLKPGMFIHDLDCGWMDHPFLRNSFKISDDAEIRKIADHGLREVYIDTEQGLDASEAKSEAEVRAELQQEMIEAVQVKPAPRHEIPLRDELIKAAKVQGEANRIVHGIMHDIRLGKQIKVEQLNPTVEQMADSIFRNKDALLNLCRIKQKDDYTFQHSVSICALMIAFCRALEHDQSVIRLAGVGGLLHDVGKMKVPSAILNKPGKLTEKEFATMKSHVAHSCEILKQTPGISQISMDIAAQHHERIDGTGYPLGLKEDKISLYGQMSAIVDVYDALTSDRCYHKGMQPTDALRKLFEWSKFHFNEKLVHAFVRCIGIYPVGTLVRLESGLLAVVVEQHHNLLQPRVRAFFDTYRDHTVPPQDIDLSKPVGHGGGDRIVRQESPTEWDIDPQVYLQVH